MLYAEMPVAEHYVIREAVIKLPYKNTDAAVTVLLEGKARTTLIYE